MKFVLVNDGAPRAPSTCAHYSTSIGTSYLRDLSSKLPYCDYECYLRHKLVPMMPLAGAGIDGLPMMDLHWASDFQRTPLGRWDM